MKCCIFIFYISLCGSVTLALDNLQGWNYINLHCRDNDNIPVDWWYIYKPPGDMDSLDSGHQFSYITPDSGGRWQQADRFITANSMLQHTLSPLFRPTYSDYLAMVAYGERDNDGTYNGSSGIGVLMADELGGLWLSHTVPGLPNLELDRPTFPEKEIENGHMIICLSLDLISLNHLAAAIRIVSPAVTRIKVPPMKSFLPDWSYMDVPLSEALNSKPPRPLNFLTTDKTLRGIMTVRSPGDRRCLYKSFARTKRIVLDIYGHDIRKKPICDVNYSLRNINAISLKHPEKVFYINNQTDRVGFAVSTAAHWQRSGANSQQFWTCTSSLEKEDGTAKGGLILCVEDYDVWLSFDNLKIKEPEC